MAFYSWPLAASSCRHPFFLTLLGALLQGQLTIHGILFMAFYPLPLAAFSCCHPTFSHFWVPTCRGSRTCACQVCWLQPSIHGLGLPAHAGICFIARPCAGQHPNAAAQSPIHCNIGFASMNWMLNATGYRNKRPPVKAAGFKP
eukprot:921584-Pelagomonas_calceolata.AAC.1